MSSRIPSLRTLPRHLAVILDGNRRWAEQRNRALADAYLTGAARVHELVTWCEEAGIQVVTVWALSQDNLSRSAQSVSAITRAVTSGVQAMAASERWRIRPVGALDRLPGDEAEALRAVEAATRHHDGTTLNVAVAYSGRDDILTAVRALVDEHRDSRLDVAGITEKQLSRHLSTAGQPDVDLLIRTAGEQRLSGFMPWQADQAELYFTDTPWPDFDRPQFTRALTWYAHRVRRFGQ
ncbi:polyprenyl diphosphate synthase [Lentzea sp. NPDC059081]|uniref:polyprenyl diphosphate synthase n=1 Tax=Lentzea sp. NPDC059081 TaxID=3346719 RepID=UPI0036A84BCB